MMFFEGKILLVISLKPKNSKRCGITKINICYSCGNIDLISEYLLVYVLNLGPSLNSTIYITCASIDTFE